MRSAREISLDTISSLFSTSFDSPPTPRFPIAMRNTEILTVVCRTDPGLARALVPQPLESIGDLVLVHIHHMHDSDWFGDHHESAVHIPVRRPESREFLK